MKDVGMSGYGGMGEGVTGLIEFPDHKFTWKEERIKHWNICEHRTQTFCITKQ
jgi:hypothetical protein